VINPTSSELKDSRLNLIIAGSEDAIMMVEAGAQEVSEATIVEALNFGHQEIKKIVGLQKKLMPVQAKKREFVSTADAKLQEEISNRAADLRDALNTQKYGKIESYSRVDALRTACGFLS
jgi:polyribonucleotide nucleotidyltransferase